MIIYFLTPSNFAYSDLICCNSKFYSSDILYGLKSSTNDTSWAIHKKQSNDKKKCPNVTSFISLTTSSNIRRTQHFHRSSINENLCRLLSQILFSHSWIMKMRENLRQSSSISLRSKDPVRETGWENPQIRDKLSTSFTRYQTGRRRRFTSPISTRNYRTSNIEKRMNELERFIKDQKYNFRIAYLREKKLHVSSIIV